MRYREAAGRINKQGTVSHPPNVWTTTDAITQALQARCEADAADPEHADPVWREDEALMKATHADLVAFYARYLSPHQDVA